MFGTINCLDCNNKITIYQYNGDYKIMKSNYIKLR